MNKKLIFMIVMLTCCFISLPVALATNGNLPELQNNNFFAKGYDITISAKNDGEGATITWDGGSLDVLANTNIFGGNDEMDVEYKSTNITMTGGTVANIFGGGLHKSNVKTSNITITGGTVTGSISGGGSAAFNNCHTWYTGDASKSTNRVEEANITIDDVSGNPNVFGGGSGISYTGVANININGGNYGWITAGGANGYTGDAIIEMTGGKAKVVQGVNRGSMGTIDIMIDGATVENVYVGGENGDSNVTGTFESGILSISGHSTVTKISAGKNGETDNSAKDKAVLVYNANLKDKIEKNSFNEEFISETVTITLYTDDEEIDVEWPTNTTEAEEAYKLIVKQLKQELESENFQLDGFYTDTTYATEYDFNSVKSGDKVYVKISKISNNQSSAEENPNTSDINIWPLIIIIGIGVVGLIIVLKKKFFN